MAKVRTELIKQGQADLLKHFEGPVVVDDTLLLKLKEWDPAHGSDALRLKFGIRSRVQASYLARALTLLHASADPALAAVVRYELEGARKAEAHKHYHTVTTGAMPHAPVAGVSSRNQTKW